jgi:hypothetical protein
MGLFGCVVGGWIQTCWKTILPPSSGLDSGEDRIHGLVVVSCSVVVIHQCFGGLGCLHLQGSTLKME